MAKPVKIATICLCSRDDKAKNIEKATRLITEAAEQGAEWILLPEIFAFNGSYSQYHEMAEQEGSPLLMQLKGLCRSLNICIFAGSVGEQSDDSNTQLSRKGDRRR